MATFSNILGALAGRTGRGIDYAGKFYRSVLPEMNVSENLQRIGGMLNPVKTAKVADLPQVYRMSTSDPYAGSQSIPTNTIRTNDVNGTTSGTVDLGGSTDVNLTADAWETARRAIEAQNPVLDQTYDLAKGDINAGIKSAEQAGETQKTSVNKRYGDILANQLRTYQDLSRQRQGTFAGLGTLESSAFGEQQARADQSLAEGRTATENNNAADIKSIDDQVGGYRDVAGRELGKLAIQWQSGKNAISSALANNDIQAAAAIKDTIDQIRTKAMTLASMLPGLNTSISGINGENYANDVTKQLANVTASGNSLYTLPASTNTGSGFIGPDGKKYKSYAEFLQSQYLT